MWPHECCQYKGAEFRGQRLPSFHKYCLKTYNNVGGKGGAQEIYLYPSSILSSGHAYSQHPCNNTTHIQYNTKHTHSMLSFCVHLLTSHTACTLIKPYTYIHITYTASIHPSHMLHTSYTYPHTLCISHTIPHIYPSHPVWPSHISHPSRSR